MISPRKLEEFTGTFLSHQKGQEALLASTDPELGTAILGAFQAGTPLDDLHKTEVMAAMEEAFGGDPESVATFYICQEDDDYPVELETFAGVFWINPLEGDSEGYFANAKEAESYAFMNWDNLSSGPTTNLS